MKIKLLDYKGVPKMVEIPDSCMRVSGDILSGDMVMREPFFCDSSDCRTGDYYDGSWSLDFAQFSKWNAFGDYPYAILYFLEQLEQ